MGNPWQILSSEFYSDFKICPKVSFNHHMLVVRVIGIDERMKRIYVRAARNFRVVNGETMLLFNEHMSNVLQNPVMTEF